MTKRHAAVAGRFYPGSPDVLASAIDDLLKPLAPSPVSPKVIVAPHAGYVYSGPIAATAFAQVMSARDRIRRVVLIGPAHRAYVRGLAAPGVDAMETPLGDAIIDRKAIANVGVPDDANAHEREHSLEVELPFIQRIIPNALLIPLVVGRASPEEVGGVLDQLWGGPETLIVISSDLSHYHPYGEGRAMDNATAERIVALCTDIAPEEACGAAALNGLAWVARKRALHGALLDLRSSGDTAGSRGEVVGYGAFAFGEA